MNIPDMVVRVYGDAAVVTARADVKGHQLGEDFSGPYRYTRVWVRRTGHWLAVSYQATVTQEDCGQWLRIPMIPGLTEKALGCPRRTADGRSPPHINLVVPV